MMPSSRVRHDLVAAGLCPTGPLGSCLSGPQSYKSVLTHSLATEPKPRAQKMKPYILGQEVHPLGRMVPAMISVRGTPNHDVGWHGVEGGPLRLAIAAVLMGCPVASCFDTGHWSPDRLVT